MKKTRGIPNHAASSKTFKYGDYAIWIDKMSYGETSIKWILDYNIGQFGGTVGLTGER